GFQRLPRNVARTQARTARQDDQVGIGRLPPLTDLALDVLDLVADHRPSDDLAGNARQLLADFLSTLIGAFATRPLGTHGQHAGTKPHPMKSRSPDATPRTRWRESAGASLRRDRQRARRSCGRSR